MAELLVKAQEPWNNDIDTSKMRKNELTQFNARSRKGDIIVIRPDGWKWGREECLPRFIVIKISDLKIEDAKKYEESLFEEYTDDKGVEQTRMLKVRKYQIPQSVMNNAIQTSQSDITVNKQQKDIFIANIIQKAS